MKYKVKIISSKRKRKGKKVEITQVENVLYFDVNILEKKKNYGRMNYLITPKSGKGKTWVRNLTK